MVVLTVKYTMWEPCRVVKKPENPRQRADVLEGDQRFAANMKALREQQGLSQGEMAKQLREAGLETFHQTTVSRIEKGERPVRIGEAGAIAEVLGRTLEGLLTPTVERDFLERFATALRDAQRAQRKIGQAVVVSLDAKAILRPLVDEAREIGLERLDEASPGFEGYLEAAEGVLETSYQEAIDELLTRLYGVEDGEEPSHGEHSEA